MYPTIILPILAALGFRTSCQSYPQVYSCPSYQPCGCENKCHHCHECDEGCETSVTSCTQTQVDLSGINWKDAPMEMCCCQLNETQALVDSGFESWRLDPVSVASRYMQNCFIDDCFRGYPNYLAGKCSCNGKVYVVLGVTCSGRMIFELCQPVKSGECGIWIVTRYGKYC